MTREIRAIDMFAGWGGFSLAVEQAGVNLIFAANHWPLACAAHKLNHPEILATEEEMCQDLSQYDWNKLTDPPFAGYELLTASPACQGWSTAGRVRRRRYHDNLKATMWAPLDCIDVTQPKACIVENVTSVREWPLYPIWLQALEFLGYSVKEYVLRASYYGVPQARERLFIVGVRRKVKDWPEFRRTTPDEEPFGPYLLDVRRAALGMLFLMEPLEGVEPANLRATSDALATGYAEEIALRAAGESGWDPVTAATTCSEFLTDLVDEAIEEGVERKRLFKYADPDEDGELAFVLDEAFDEDNEAWFALTDEEQAQLDRLLEAYAPHAPADFRLVDAARKYGSGVASLPAVRYRLIWDRGHDGFDDDSLLQLREVIDAPAAPGLIHPVPGLFEDHADRLAGAPRIFWSSGDEGDLLLAGLRDGTQAFKATGTSSWFQDIEHDKVAEAWDEGELDPGGLVCLAEALGRSIAAAHARSVTPDGEPALPAIAGDLAGREVEFAEERQRDAEVDLARTLDDHRRFLRLLDEHGPRLGIETLPEDGPR